MTDDPIKLTGVTPHITIRDGRAAEAIAFYTRAFGASEVHRQPADDGKRLLHAHMLVNGGSLMMHDDFPEYMGGKPSEPPACVVLHLQVDDPDAAFERAVAAGAEVRLAMADQFWGDRYGQVVDPFGHLWSIGAPIRR